MTRQRAALVLLRPGREAQEWTVLLKFCDEIRAEVTSLVHDARAAIALSDAHLVDIVVSITSDSEGVLRDALDAEVRFVRAPVERVPARVQLQRDAIISAARRGASAGDIALVMGLALREVLDTLAPERLVERHTGFARPVEEGRVLRAARTPRRTQVLLRRPVPS